MTSLPKLSPMPLIQFPAPFDDPDFLFEVKFDGFQAWPTSTTATARSSPGRVTSTAGSPISASSPSGYLPEGPRREQHG